MMNKETIKFYSLAFALVLTLSACQQAGENVTGSEYMPDMYHSVANETNLYSYYYFNTWGSEDEYYKFAQPRTPVDGTVPRGYAGLATAPDQRAMAMTVSNLTGEASVAAIRTPVNSNVPYHYVDTEEDRVRASNEIIFNPFPITEKGLAQGKELYDLFCGICHGEKGDGNGYLVAEENLNAAYPAAPANFLLDTFLNSTNGRYYHAIMYGKNVMGAYPDKISYEERWQVIHWIRALQAKEKKLVYNAEENTLNQIDIPVKLWKGMSADMGDDPATIGDEGDDEMNEDRPSGFSTGEHGPGYHEGDARGESQSGELHLDDHGPDEDH